MPVRDAPAPTAARPGKPTVVAAVGDSITQSTGTGALAQENPKNSWATGWEVNSVAARLGVATGNRYNLSANGDRMSDFAPQILNGKSGGSGDVPALPASTGLVLVEFGGNDLCRDSVAQMTSVETYRSQFQAGLAATQHDVIPDRQPGGDQQLLGELLVHPGGAGQHAHGKARKPVGDERFHTLPRLKKGQCNDHATGVEGIISALLMCCAHVSARSHQAIFFRRARPPLPPGNPHLRALAAR